MYTCANVCQFPHIGIGMRACAMYMQETHVHCGHVWTYETSYRQAVV